MLNWQISEIKEIANLSASKLYLLCIFMDQCCHRSWSLVPVNTRKYVYSIFTRTRTFTSVHPIQHSLIRLTFGWLSKAELGAGA